MQDEPDISTEWVNWKVFKTHPLLGKLRNETRQNFSKSKVKTSQDCDRRESTSNFGEDNYFSTSVQYKCADNKLA